MPTWLSDPSPTFYLILFVLAVIAAGMWVRHRDRRSAVGAAVAAGVLLLVFAVDRLVESPREESVRRVNEMAAAVNERNPDKFLDHVSDRFRYGAINREGLRTIAAWQLVRTHDVRVAVWDFARDDVQRPSDDEVVVGFMSKGESGGREMPFYIRATFGRDPDGRWRLRTFAAYENPLQRANSPEVTLPGFAR